jgi:hypothetical protein
VPSTRWGRANFLVDRSQPIHLTGDELATLTGVQKTTMANKARRICDLVDLGPLDFEFGRRECSSATRSAGSSR